MKARRKSRKTRHLVITPFIDIAFILVLFFIVDSSFELSPTGRFSSTGRNLRSFRFPKR